MLVFVFWIEKLDVFLKEIDIGVWIECVVKLW